MKEALVACEVRSRKKTVRAGRSSSPPIFAVLVEKTPRAQCLSSAHMPASARECPDKCMALAWCDFAACRAWEAATSVVEFKPLDAGAARVCSCAADLHLS